MFLNTVRTQTNTYAYVISLTSKTKKSKQSYENPLRHWKQIPAVLGPLELLNRPPVGEADEEPVWRRAPCPLLCRQKRAEHALCLGASQLLAELGEMQEWPDPFQVSAGKYAEHKVFYYLPKIQRPPCSLFYSIVCASRHQGGGGALCNHLTLSWEQREALS